MDNRNELLKRLSQNKQNKHMEMRSMEARHRLMEQEKEKEKGGGANESAAVVSVEKTNKPPVAIFGVKSHFTIVLKDTLQQYCEIYEFSEADKATDFLFSNQIPAALIDMDAPNDPKNATEFFSTGKTINPNMRYIIYHKEDKMPEAVEAMAKQGAAVFKKPIDRIELIERVKEFTAKWRQENASKQADEETDDAEDIENISAY
ncbi:MAG: hypothetical protein FWE23_11355 [Chitinivibrionia bacterium]|nr:hypothetical protein [Chitinivibrionia bacterium]